MKEIQNFSHNKLNSSGFFLGTYFKLKCHRLVCFMLIKYCSLIENIFIKINFIKFY